MVTKTKSVIKSEVHLGRKPPSKRDVVVIKSYPGGRKEGGRLRSRQIEVIESDAEDVIDLGAPRHVRRQESEKLPGAPERRPHHARRPYTPNPRLYPGPQESKGKTEAKSRARLQEPHSAGASRERGRRRRPTRRPRLPALPNARLYKPAAPRRAPAPAAAPPSAASPSAWTPAAPRALDTASRAALRLLAARAAPKRPATRAPTPAGGTSPPRRRASPDPSPRPPRRPPSRRIAPPPPSPPRFYLEIPRAQTARAPPCRGSSPRRSASPRSPQQLVVTLPKAPVSAASKLFFGSMAAAQSGSPDECSDAELSAPSEFLAEFLSAIMRRQYAEALKYCRLILQYEPHNATARGFYPLLRHKLRRAQASRSESSSSSASPPNAATPASLHSRAARAPDTSDPGSPSSGSCASLELDSSPPSGSWQQPDRDDSHASHSHSQASHSLASNSNASHSHTSGLSLSADDNGNTQLSAHWDNMPLDDLQNDNAAASGEPHHLNNTTALKTDSVGATLRRLRAQFACSIK